MSQPPRGFLTRRELFTEAGLWLLCGFILMALFVAGLWYVWPDNGVAAPTESVTHPELVP